MKIFIDRANVAEIERATTVRVGRTNATAGRTERCPYG
jgi:hypothetical protein